MTLEIIDKRVAIAWIINTAFYSKMHTASLQQFANAAFRCYDNKVPMKPFFQFFSLIKTTENIESKRILRPELENLLATLIELGCDVAIEEKCDNPSRYFVYAYR